MNKFHSPCLMVTVILAAALSPPVRAQEETTPRSLVLRVSSAEPSQPVSFKGAFVVDHTTGLQYVEATTPFEIRGTSDWAIGVFQKLTGIGSLRAELFVGDDDRSQSSAMGPRTVMVEFNPRRELVYRLRESLRR